MSTRNAGDHVRAGAIVFIVFCFAALAHTELYFQTSFDKDFRGKKETGSYHISPQGLRIDGDSRVRITSPRKLPSRNGTLEIDLLPPHGVKSSMPLRSAGSGCFCALTVHIGRGAVEVSERGIRLLLFDKNLKHVVETLESSPHTIIGSSKIHALEIDIHDGTADIRIDGTPALSGPIREHDLTDLSIGSYAHAATISSVRLSLKTRDTLIVNTEGNYLELGARFHPSHFTRPTGIQNHHYVVWEDGKASGNALFTTYASDIEIHDALVALGATPGNNLTMATWNKRRNPRHPDPDLRVEGARIKADIHYNNRVFPTDQILQDANGKSIDLRFGGNKEFIPAWKSGCVICLQSCPGAKIGNHTYTIRDLHKGIPQFEISSMVPFTEGDEVTIRLHVPTDEPTSTSQDR